MAYAGASAIGWLWNGVLSHLSGEMWGSARWNFCSCGKADIGETCILPWVSLAYLKGASLAAQLFLVAPITQTHNLLILIFNLLHHDVQASYGNTAPCRAVSSTRLSLSLWTTSNCFSCMGIVIPITPFPIPTPFPIGPIAIDPPIVIDPFPFPIGPYPAGCPTHTINHSCPAMTLHCGPQPDCILIKTVTQPFHCPSPMPTVLAPCPTCHTGCETIVRTVTATCDEIIPTATAA